MENKLSALGGRISRISCILVGIALTVLPPACRAANNCPWINEATASGILGGPAVGAATGIGTTTGTAVCEFTQQGEGFKRTLRITVEIATEPHVRLGEVAQICGVDAAPLKAVGNEALSCSASDRKIGQGERIIGRVRDQVFTIVLNTTLKDDPILTRDALKMRVGTAAEQVTGNLF